jgi:hypothetical protein
MTETQLVDKSRKILEISLKVVNNLKIIKCNTPTEKRAVILSISKLVNDNYDLGETKIIEKIIKIFDISDKILEDSKVIICRNDREIRMSLFGISKIVIDNWDIIELKRSDET